MNWFVRRHELNVERGGVLMGIVNVTPDSFSDGGRFYALEEALGHAEELERQGAVILDIGGESTRPGAAEVSADEEVARVLPVVRELRKQSEAVISVDTRHAAVAAAVLEAGADVINDISGLSDPGMAELCAEARCGVVVMHMQGRPETMQDAPAYGDVLEEVRRYFEERYDFLLGKGLLPEQVCWDPGIGFGKTLDHNLTLLSNMDQLHVAGRPVLLGLSRKRMLGAILGGTDSGREPLSTAVMTVWGHLHGAQIHRVHDVEESARALRLVQAAEPFVR
ncbi:dihydropteroate synthase [uncultured Akkermansia sp.]|uniref:dihydropteroate synthase n=1 Tax=Akkermansia sp. TaxID=1872421 RepID=UPI0025CF3D64|nr:dihydropteroate synthase [uncultured Akkermansia sp.]